MSIYLNGTKIPGYAQKVSADLTLASEDMSGNSSHTPQADKGDKPKSIKVQTSIKFSDAADLSLIVNMAEGKNSAGERTIYNIINHTANAMNIRRVSFDGSLSVKENETTEDWSISLSLIEYESVPEKKEGRKAEKKVKEQAAKGTPATSANVSATPEIKPAISDQTVDLTPFEKIVKDFDTKLGGK